MRAARRALDVAGPVDRADEREPVAGRERAVAREQPLALASHPQPLRLPAGTSGEPVAWLQEAATAAPEPPSNRDLDVRDPAEHRVAVRGCRAAAPDVRRAPRQAPAGARPAPVTADDLLPRGEPAAAG